MQMHNEKLVDLKNNRNKKKLLLTSSIFGVRCCHFLTPIFEKYRHRLRNTENQGVEFCFHFHAHHFSLFFSLFLKRNIWTNTKNEFVLDHIWPFHITNYAFGQMCVCMLRIHCMCNNVRFLCQVCWKNKHNKQLFYHSASVDFGEHCRFFSSSLLLLFKLYLANRVAS